MEQREGSFVVYASVDSGVRPTSAKHVESSSRVRNKLKLKRQSFLAHYGELQHADSHCS